MSTLNVVLTHLPAAEVHEQLGVLARVAPRARFVVCHGGRPEDCADVSGADAAHIGDPSLRGAPRSFQAYHEIFATVLERWMDPSAGFDAAYLIEFDHLVLRPDFEDALRGLAHRTGAGMLGKHCAPRAGTNWEHYGRFRRDPALLAHLRRLSVRDDPGAIYGTLGDGMWLTRDALAAYVAVGEHPPCYGELYVPTLLHHLGFDVVDVDAHSDLYDHVRWEPPYTPGEVERLAAGGATFAHPVKDLATWRRVGLAQA